MNYPKEINENLQILVSASNEFGRNPEYVLAGGGNTSWKNSEYLFIKGSGTSLAGITAEGFVAMNRKKLGIIWGQSYSADSEKREAEVLADLMESRLPSGLSKRPSVETLLHDLFPYAFIIHTHPALVNGVTCSQNGKRFTEQEYGDRAVWIDVEDPGYILALKVKNVTGKMISDGKDFPKIVFLQNHGVFVAADSIDEIWNIYSDLFYRINSHIKRLPDLSEKTINSGPGDQVSRSVLNLLPDMKISAFFPADLAGYSENREKFKPLSLAFTPDHIVYYGYKPLYIENPDETGTALSEFISEEGAPPKIVVIAGKGAFAIGSSDKLVHTAKELFLDAIKIAVYTESFGGHLFLPEKNINFIRNWEVEKYRASIQREKD